MKVLNVTKLIATESNIESGNKPVYRMTLCGLCVDNMTQYGLCVVKMTQCGQDDTMWTLYGQDNTVWTG